MGCDPHSSSAESTALAIAALRRAPWAAVPLFFAIWLALEVSWGYEGGAAKKQAKDYWRKNLATYLDARVPDIEHVELDLELFPDRSRYRVKGSYDLHNDSQPPLDEILLTAGPHWEKLSWTVDGKPSSPTNRAGLFVFAPSEPLLAGKSIRVGFEHEGSVPRGISKKGGGTPEFILPSSVVLTSFRPTIVPVLGYVEDAGIDDDNRHDAKEYKDNFFEGQTDSFTGARPVHDAHSNYGPGGVHLELGGREDSGHGRSRPSHRGLGKRSPGQLLQCRRRPLAGRARCRHGCLLPRCAFL